MVERLVNSVFLLELGCGPTLEHKCICLRMCICLCICMYAFIDDRVGIVLVYLCAETNNNWKQFVVALIGVVQMTSMATSMENVLGIDV